MQAQIDQEILDRTNADNTERAEREASDANLQAQINDTNADLANEINRATTAEADLQNQINEKATIVDLEQETLDRINADADLQAQLDQEKIDREVGDSDLQSTIDVEMSRIEVEQADQNRKIENIENILLANINALYKPTNDVAITTSTKVPLTLLDGTSDVIVNSNIRIPNVATGTVLKYNFNFDLSGDGTGYGRAINVTKGGAPLGIDTPIQGETKFQVTRVVKVVDGTPSIGEANIGDEIEIQLTKTTGVTFSVLSTNSTITAQGTSSSAPGLTSVTTNDVATVNVSFVTDGSSSTLAFNDLNSRMENKLDRTGGMMAGNIDMNGNDINNIDALEVANITYNTATPPVKTINNAPADAIGNINITGILNDIDINYDDTIHATTPLQDILKDLFDKAQAVVGIYKPFELTFSIRDQEGFPLNITRAIRTLIEEKYGTTIGTITMKFKMEVSTVVGVASSRNSNSNKCSVSLDGIVGTGSYYEWYFDYDGWSNVIVRDAKGYLSENPEMLYTSSGNLGTDITLSDSIYNFEKITCSMTDAVGGFGDGMVYINVLGSGRLTFQEATQGTEGYYLYLTVLNSDVSGKNLTSNNNIYSRRYTHTSGQLLIEDRYLQSVSGLNRIYPLGTTHSLETIDGKLYKKITLPNGEVTLKETKIQQDFYVSDDK